jgi:purine catabolism regulator
MDGNMIVYIIMSPEIVENTWEKVERCTNQLRQYKNQFMNYRNSNFAIGKKVSRSTDLYKSYTTAAGVVDKIGKNCGETIIYDRQYINRIMAPLCAYCDLSEFVSDLLGVLLEPGNQELLQTLKVYFECNCSKQKTAEKLFIVRQTLYFRLEKVEDILGSGFDEGERRFALEFAIHAHDYSLRNEGG